MPSYSKPCMQLGGAAQDDLGGLQPPKPPLDPPLDYVTLCCPRVHHARVHGIVRNYVHVRAVRMLIKRPLPASVIHLVKIVNIFDAQ